MMKKALLLLTIISFPLFASAQTTEKQYYIYNIATFYGSVTDMNVRVYLDDGKNVKMQEDEEGETIRFNTQAAALMFLKKRFIQVNSQPCTKDEFDEVVKEGIRL